MGALALALGVVVAAGALWSMLLYNGLVRLRQHALESFSQVDVELDRRRALVPNLVESVKGWAQHERETLSAIAAARAGRDDHGPSKERFEGETRLSGAIDALIVACEAYPDLQSSDGFRRLSGELAHTEDRIAAALRFFNSNVRAYETRRQQLPEALVAAALGFGKLEHYQLPVSRTEVETAPRVAA